MKRAARIGGGCLAGLFLAATLGGCSTKWYRESADREVYGIVDQKEQVVLGESTKFTIDPATVDILGTLRQQRQPLAGETEQEAPGMPATEAPRVLTLRDSLMIGMHQSRDYQNRKEDVYLTALDLTLERDRWTPRFFGLLSGGYSYADGNEAWVGDTEFGVTQLLATGAAVSMSISTEFIRHITGSPDASAVSFLSASIIQPLWRGAGIRVAQENLRQSERDVIYAVRSFARYNRTFAVDIASSYYRLLLQRAVVGNEWQNFRQLVQSRQRAEMLAQAGRRPEFEVDQAKQDELTAQDRWIRAVQSYRQSLDQFKIKLSLPTDANVDVDEAELAQLTQQGILHPGITAEKAIEQALALRLDLQTAEDQVVDAGRRVYVAENGLGADVDLVFTAGTPSETGKPLKFRFERGAYGAGFDVALPLERTAERNTYRTALIQYDRALRNAEDFVDNVKLEVRQAWRRLQEARESYEIQVRSLALAERRVESTTLLLQAGRATTRDLLESQAAVLSARNAVVQRLVDHTVTRLELWRDIGTLGVGPEGRIEEQKRHENIAPRS